MRLPDLTQLHPLALFSLAQVKPPLLPLHAPSQEISHPQITVFARESSSVSLASTGSGTAVGSEEHRSLQAPSTPTLAVSDLFALDSKSIEGPIAEQSLGNRKALAQLARDVTLDNTYGALPAHVMVRVGSTAWRAIQTSPAAFLGTPEVKGSYWAGAAHVAGGTLLAIAGPRLAASLMHDNYETRASGKAKAARSTTNWLTRGLMALTAVQLFADPVATGPALLAGAAGVALTKGLPKQHPVARLVAGHAHWLMMEAARVAVPIGVHSAVRGARIKEFEAALAKLPQDEDLERAWTQSVFVGGHLAQDTGNTPFYTGNRSLGPLAHFGRFASHQSLTLSQQIDAGYDAFTLEYFADDNDQLRNSHSTVWDYGLLQDTLHELRAGLERNPEAVIVIKGSPQGTPFNATKIFYAASDSGLTTLLPAFDLAAGRFVLPSPFLTKNQLREQNIRAIWLSNFYESTWGAESLADLTASAKPDLTPWNLYRAPDLSIINLFQSWGFLPFSEHVNQHMPRLLQIYHQAMQATSLGLGVVFANDLETSGLLAFKRLYNAPR